MEGVGASDDFCIALYEIRNLLSPEIKLYTTRPATESPLPFWTTKENFFSDLSNSAQSPRDWHNILATNRQDTAVFFDIRKAFDSVPHHHILTSLSSLGVSGPLLAWFSN